MTSCETPPILSLQPQQVYIKIYIKTSKFVSTVHFVRVLESFSRIVQIWKIRQLLESCLI